jgi:hypothetical protein
MANFRLVGVIVFYLFIFEFIKKNAMLLHDLMFFNCHNSVLN